MFKTIIKGGVQAWKSARDREKLIRAYRKILSNYKYIHVMNNGIHSGIILEFINKYFDRKDHCFIFPKMTTESEARFQQYGNCLKAPLDAIPLDRVDKIIFHGLFTRSFIEFLFEHDNFLAKSYWFIWGGDLYCCDDDIAGFVKSRFAGVLTTFDWDEYVRRFGPNQYFDVSYPGYMNASMLPKGFDVDKVGRPVVIMVNNCADETTLDMLDVLSKFKDEDIVVRLVLSYSTVGQQDYRQKIKEKAKELFGRKADFITEFLPPEEYVLKLASVDIYISNQSRQQGNGNASFLCSIGKKVFMRNCSSIYKTYNALGIRYFDTDSIRNMSFDEFIEYDKDVKEQTISLLSKRMADETKIEQWKKFFDYE